MAKKHTAQCACGAIKFEFDIDPSFHSDSSRCASRQVKYSTQHKRPVVVHSNIYRLAVAGISDD
jgi:hypothetical protein